MRSLGSLALSASIILNSSVAAAAEPRMGSTSEYGDEQRTDMLLLANHRQLA